MEQNRVIYDWFTFTTKIHSLPDVIELLGLQEVKFEQFDKGRYCYQNRLYYDGINIMYNGREDMGICVEMSGQGCRNFESFGSGNYQGIFDMIIDNWSEKAEQRQMNITRLDVAYDDFIGLLDLNYFVKATQQGNFVSKNTNWEVIVSNKGCTVGHGDSHSSPVYIRIYDKKAERHRTDIEHWVRCEIKMKDDNARGFIKLKTDVRKSYFQVLNNYLRYIIPSNDNTKCRVSVAPEWLRFIEDFEKVSIFDKPGAEYNILKLDYFVFNQGGKAIKTMIDVLGPEKFLADLNEVNKNKKTNPKYSAIREKMGVKTSENDNILAFLESRGAV